MLLSAAEDGYIAYDVHLDRLYRLNPTAGLIVELCDGSRDRARLQADLEPLVDDSGRGWLDWLDTAIRDGLLTEGSPVSDCGAAPEAAELARQAESLRRRDRVLAAFVCQQHATALAPDDPALLLQLGELAHIVGRRDEARAAYQLYLARCPDDAEVTHLVAALSDATPPARVSNRCIEQLYGRFADFYDENMTGELDYCAPARLYRATVAALQGRSELDVLDLGCGTGLGGERWRARARYLVGVDLSAQMIARAQLRGVYDRLDTDEISAWLERDTSERFDLIIACDTLIYFGDLRQVVRPARRRLKPGGLLGFTVERGDTDPVQLSDSGRFTHHGDHVLRAVAEAGLTMDSLHETTIRYEYGEPVLGLIAVCRG